MGVPFSKKNKTKPEPKDDNLSPDQKENGNLDQVPDSPDKTNRKSPENYRNSPTKPGSDPRLPNASDRTNQQSPDNFRNSPMKPGADSRLPKSSKSPQPDKYPSSNAYQPNGKTPGGRDRDPKSQKQNMLRGPCPVLQETYSDKIYFDDKEMKRLKKKFETADVEKKGEITLNQFGDMIELISHSFRERILNLTEDKLTQEGSARLNFDIFIKILSVFHYKCPEEVKRKYLFRIYDVNGDNLVDERDIAYMMNLIFFTNETKAQGSGEGYETSFTNPKFLEKLAKDIIASFDRDGNGKLGYPEFTKMISEGDIETRMNITF